MWDANYRFVLHMGELTGNPVDATSNGVGSQVDPGNEGVVIFRGEMGSPSGSSAWDLATDMHPPPWTPPATFQPSTDTYLAVADGTLPANSSFTIEAWFLMDSVDPGFLGFVTKNRDSGVDWVGLFKNGAPAHQLNLDWPCCAPNRPGNLNGPAIVAGQWYHAVATYNGATSTRRLFPYGTQVATDTVGAQYANLTNPTRVGNDSNGNYLDGKVDEIRISNIERSPAKTLEEAQALIQKVLDWEGQDLGARPSSWRITRIWPGTSRRTSWTSRRATLTSDRQRLRDGMHAPVGIEHRGLVGAVFGSRLHELRNLRRLPAAAPTRDHDRPAMPADDAGVNKDPSPGLGRQALPYLGLERREKLFEVWRPGPSHRPA